MKSKAYDKQNDATNDYIDIIVKQYVPYELDVGIVCNANAWHLTIQNKVDIFIQTVAINHLILIVKSHISWLISYNHSPKFRQQLHSIWNCLSVNCIVIACLDQVKYKYQYSFRLLVKETAQIVWRHCVFLGARHLRICVDWQLERRKKKTCSNHTISIFHFNDVARRQK